MQLKIPYRLVVLLLATPTTTRLVSLLAIMRQGTSEDTKFINADFQPVVVRSGTILNIQRSAMSMNRSIPIKSTKTFGIQTNIERI